MGEWLESARSSGQPNHQLHALLQAMQLLAAGQDQLQDRVGALADGSSTLYRLVCQRWAGVAPAELPAADNSPTIPVAEPEPPRVTAPEPTPQVSLSSATSPSPNRQENSPEAAQLLGKALYLDGAAYVMDRPRHSDPARGISVWQDRQLCQGMQVKIDTGCTVCLTYLSVVQHHGIEWHPLTDAPSVTLANGASAAVLGVTGPLQVVLLSGTPDELITSVHALVMPTHSGGVAGSCDLLLGKRWLAEHSITVHPHLEILRYRLGSRLAAVPLITKTTVPPGPTAQPVLHQSMGVRGASVSACVGVVEPSSSPAVASCSSELGGAPAVASCSSELTEDDDSQSIPELVTDDSDDEEDGLVSCFSVAGAMAASPLRPFPLLPDSFEAAQGPRQLPSSYPGAYNPLEDLQPLPGAPDVVEPDAVLDELHGWHYGAQLASNPDRLHQFTAMLQRNLDAFAFTADQLVGYTGGDAGYEGVRIPLQPGVTRVFEPERRCSPQHLAIQDSKCQELLDVGWIREVPTTNAFASNTTCPGKKDAEGNWTERRFCIDLRSVNQATIPDSYRPPLPEDLFNSLGHSTYLTKFDLRAGFHQLPLHPDSVAVTAFWWRRRLFAYTRMPFGLRNATAEFQRVVDNELQAAGLTHCAKVFVDDVLVHSATFEEHLQHVEALLQCLRRCGLRAHPKKSSFRCSAP